MYDVQVSDNVNEAGSDKSTTQPDVEQPARAPQSQPRPVEATTPAIANNALSATPDVGRTADELQKRWGPLVGIVMGTISITAAVMVTLSSRASATDLNEAQKDLQKIHEDVASIKATVEALKASAKEQTSTIVSNIDGNLARHESSLKELGAKLDTLNNNLTALSATVQVKLDIKAPLPKVKQP